ncbi:MAG TPA: PAS domain S-box protein [Candidatus Acidoferrales bacterium]|nr:PAS domain S-box protein [Candidatus Acidoferrales bacterium]
MLRSISSAERRKAPASSALADGNFQLLFSKNPLPMYIVDRETLQFLEVNQAAVHQYGYSRGQLLQMRTTDIRPPEEIARYKEAMRGTEKAAKGQGLWWHLRKDGTTFEVEATSEGITFAGREAVLVVAQDITPRRKAEKAIAEHSAYLDALVQNLPLAVMVLDTERRIQMCNPAFEKLFGYSLSEIKGMRPQSLLEPPERAAATAEIIKRVSAGEIVREKSQRKRSDGALVDVQALIVPLILNGARIGSVGIYEDLRERRQAEVAQQQAEEKFRRLFENAVEGIFQSTPEGKYLSVNPALARMYGYSSAMELVNTMRDIGKSLYADPLRRDQFRRTIAKNNFVEAFESEIIRKDGTRIWISENARAVRDANGDVCCYEGTVEDITERKRSESERQVTTEIVHAISVSDTLADLLSSMHLALLKVLDAQNCFVALYEPSTGVFNFPFFVDQVEPVPPPQMVWRSCAAYVYRAGRAMIISPKSFYRLVEEEEVESSRRPPASFVGVPLRTTAGSIGVLVVQNYQPENAYTRRDMEFLSSIGDQIALAIERKRAEGRIRESEARLRVLIEQLPAVLWTVDKDLRFTSVLGAGLARLNLRPNQIVGLSLQEYFETSDPTYLPFAAHRRAIAGEPVTFHVEWKNGSYACHVEPLRGGEGEVLGAICMALDITDRKELEERFRQAQKMEAVGRLAGGIAHDFNNLLMVIQGYADLLSERLSVEDPLRRNAEQIQIASQRATALTQQLLAFSRKQILAPKILNIQTVVSEMEKMLRRLIGEDIQLDTSSAKDLGLVKADRSQIEQVILNLAVNARDAMPGGGRLTIETGNVELDDSFSRAPQVLAPGKYVMLAVTDTGVGMSTETQAHIFEPFFTTKEKGKGTGLGLATVYGVVKQSGGYIWVYSEPGRGTTFKIYLPRIEQEAASAGRENSNERPAISRGSGLVLLVEDEKGVRQLTREYLEASGYTVLEAEDGQIALELSSAHMGHIDLLLTDVVMPGISGRELAERIVQMRPGIKTLYMSGYTDRAIVHHGILQTDTVLLQKPFSLATLASKIQEILTAEVVH